MNWLDSPRRIWIQPQKSDSASGFGFGSQGLDSSSGVGLSPRVQSQGLDSPPKVGFIPKNWIHLQGFGFIPKIWIHSLPTLPSCPTIPLQNFPMKEPWQPLIPFSAKIGILLPKPSFSPGKPRQKCSPKSHLFLHFPKSHLFLIYFILFVLYLLYYFIIIFLLIIYIIFHLLFRYFSNY